MIPIANSTQPSVIESDWQSLFCAHTAAVRDALATVVMAHRTEISAAFYQTMLENAHAQVFLSHEAVEQRLQYSMQQWLEKLFGCQNSQHFAEVLALQRHIGEVHSRVEVPVNLVARGARLLKREIARHLLQHDLSKETLLDALQYADSLIDLAFEEMSSAYFASHERAARTDEAYRMFSYGQNMTLERERQRSAILDWENVFLRVMMTGHEGDTVPTLSSSSFGLWLHHKANAMFDGSLELPSVHEIMQRVDHNLLPLCQSTLNSSARDDVRRLCKAVQAELGQLKFLLDTLFERYVDLESGKDALTQLLNRRFLPAILSREIELGRKQQKTFSLLLLDVDHFKTINDRYSHEAGDRVLQQLASILLNSMRSGDFVFRYGGEEFLLLLVETDLAQAQRVAEKIRSRVEQEAFLLADQQVLRTTVSIGIAVHDGHPDYQRLINRADDALYRAKQSGRNRCITQL